MNLLKHFSLAKLLLVGCLSTLLTVFISCHQAISSGLISSEDPATIVDYYPRDSQWKPSIDLSNGLIFNDRLSDNLIPADVAGKYRYSIDGLQEPSQEPLAAGNVRELLNQLDLIREDKNVPYSIGAIPNRAASTKLNIFAPVNNPNDFDLEVNVQQDQESAEALDSNRTSQMLDSILADYMDSVLKHLQDEPSESVAISPGKDDLVTQSVNLRSLMLNGPGDDADANDDDDDKSTTSNDVSLFSTNRVGPSEAGRYGDNSGGEYIDHPLALIGHQYVQGGAGEGRQLLGPEGTFENVQVVKSDRAVPSYCDPPNPCPVGYTAEDGCLENFINSASFSREYQAKQKCSCDNEHSLFNCAPEPEAQQANAVKSNRLLYGDRGDDENGQNPNGLVFDQDKEDSKLGTLARTVSNRFGSLASIRNLINGERDDFNLD